MLAVPPVAVMFGLYYTFLLVRFRPRVTRTVDVRAVRVQEELLGPPTRAEVWSVIVLVALVVGFATRPYHGIAPAWMAVGVFVVLFVVALSLTAFVLRFIVPWMTASTLLALVAIPLAEGLGFHPFIPVLVALMAGDHTFLPYLNLGYSLVYFASDGELFSHAQARWSLMVESFIRLVALVVSVPLWQALGAL